MGWYEADMSKAERKRFLYKAGCTKVGGTLLPCPTWGEPDFCVNNTLQCDGERLNAGVCRTKVYGSNLPIQFQNYAQANVGGMLRLMLEVSNVGGIFVLSII
jgi:hypothetical protein